MKTNEILSFAGKWMELENILINVLTLPFTSEFLSGIYQAQKHQMALNTLCQIIKQNYD
jgi:hypothetical protein